MDVRERLENVRRMDELINAKLEERDRLIALATDINAKPLDGMPYDNTGTVSRKMENAVVKLIDLARETDKLIDEYIDHKKAVIAALEKLPEREYAVLHRHYIRYMSWAMVARDLNYSDMQVWRIKKNGLKILEKFL